jgi:subtilisin family serine protease
VGFTAEADGSRWDLLESLRGALARDDQDVSAQLLLALEAGTRNQPAAFVQWLQKSGGRVVQRFWIVNGSVVELPPEAADALRAHAEVRSVEPDLLLGANIMAATSSANHNADFAQVDLGWRGAGTTLALLDSGVNLDFQGSGKPHPAFDSASGGTRVIHSQGIANPARTSDENGHGTAVAGVALAQNWDPASVLDDDGFAPDANLASYRITRDGASLSTTCLDLITGWQQVLADRVSHPTWNISVANCSYKGSPDPTSLTQQALDTLCYVGDVLVITSAGNDGERAFPTNFSQSNVNGLSVGSVESGSHRVVPESTYGPPVGDGNRFFPDLVAVGKEVQTVPLDELGVVSRGGTSFAAPMVAGTALLVRGARPDFDYKDTKAVILNNLQDIGTVNPGLDRQHYGLGMLRTDLAVQAALDGTLFHGTLRQGIEQRLDFPVQVVAGQEYSATLVWARTAMGAPEWDDLDLLVADQNGILRAGSANTRNVYERARFLATSTGTYTLVVGSGNMVTPRAEFSLAFGVNLGGGGQLGHYGSVGEACPGIGEDPAAGLILPPVAAGQFGNARTQVPLAYHPTRWQQAFDIDWFPTPFTIHSLAFRRDQDQGTSPGLQMDITVRLGYTELEHLSGDFDLNPLGTMETVFADSAFDLAGIASASTSIDQFDYVLPLSQPFTVEDNGHSLLMEIEVSSHTANNAPVTNWFDAVFPVLGGPILRVYSTPGSPTRITRDDLALVVNFMGSDQGPVEPRLTWEGVPQLDDSFSVILRQARPGTAAVLLFGLSVFEWGTSPLPIDLAPFGAPGCLLQVEPLVAFPVMVGQGGQGRVVFEIPNDPAFAGALFFNQFGILDVQANPLGVVLTNTGFGLVGR